VPTDGLAAVEVTAAQPAEWAVVRQLRLAALADDPAAFCATLDDEQQLGDDAWRARLERRDATTLLARRGDEAVGMVVVELHDRGPAGIVSFWVTPAGRGRGVGAALLEAAVEVARGHGHARVTLDVGDHNLRAQRLYARHGFTPTGRTSTMPPPKDHVTEHELARGSNG
jgi:ribosomal protein S18 acetylase RimI-like enzyme